ncbi:uncharacterized protein TRIADDRAFT_20532 [Trichoplax adhaerens]|uniref:Fucosyltransferase n=1 Tax=Trichoplax adhaerens TaxID=10228 RepID=B3RMP4_TRIAD|nr:hypothetical protein TRIADDRAFT_20532 [Trichoplax adhaerens]EDV27886.1 hypothetical protein TRIADDRAFT_20532 [Trichoplax adhaerens]|eukprot:XP_002109720.1 hypothetical protein TRIADDRAFT_20532 [Trichoplax adhaerens]
MGNQYFRNCSFQNCFLTTDRKLERHAAAIVFFDRDLMGHLMNFDLPDYQHRINSQRWVYYNIESPKNTYWLTSPFKSIIMFNWTMSYRRDSDVHAYYGSYGVRDYPSRSLGNVNYLASKKRFVAWMASSCLEDRTNFVYELSFHTEIDVYGSCGNRKCPRSRECWDKILRDYRFYLALENSYCIDYATEKLWNALTHDVIPVVWGGADYHKTAPPNSFIDIRQFSTVIDLANYLNRVGTDPKLYNSFFEWKIHWFIKPPQHWCNLCKKLNDRTQPRKWYKLLDNLWDPLSSCFPNDYPRDIH